MKLVRTALATLVLVTVTATPALAAEPPAAAVPSVSGGLCRLWPRLCR